MRPYELVVLLHPDLEIDLDKPLKKIEQIVTQKGKITKTDIWGKRRLAYSINKEVFAVYIYFEIELPPDQVGKVEGALNITDEVLRYILTHPVPEVEEEVDDEDKTKVAKKKTTVKKTDDKLKEEE
jgi:small subunit ribosomal protein S6